MDLAFARQADRIVVMGCDPEEACPAEVLDRVEDWELRDPRGLEEQDVRALRDEVRRRVKDLLADL